MLNFETEADFVAFLNEAIQAKIYQDDSDACDDVVGTEEEAKRTDFSVRTFEESMILTDNVGLVVRVGNSTFQVTVVDSTY